MKNNTIFNNVSVFGRVAYAIMCFEKYVVSVYPSIDYSPVVEIMWSIIDGSNYLDESAYKYYIEIIPECLFEFYSYENSDFEYLSKDEYLLFTRLLNNDDQNLNTIMKCIYDIAMAYAYTKVEPNAPATLPFLQKAKSVLLTNNIEPPDEAIVSKYTASGTDWLGECFDGRYLSIILN